MEDVVLADFLSSKVNKRKQSVTRKIDVGKNKIKAVAVKIELSVKAGDSGNNGEKFMEEESNSNGGANVMKAKHVSEKNETAEVGNEEDRGNSMKRKRGADGEIMKSFLLSPGKSSYRLRPRKEIPVFRKVELEDGDSEKIVGKRIKVYWSGSRRWFLGVIKSFDDTKCLHKIHYEDGDKEDLDLGRELFELELMPSDSFMLKTELTSVKKIKGPDGDQAGAEIMKDDLFKRGDSKQVNISMDVLPEKVEKMIKGSVHGTEELTNATSVKDSDKSKSILVVSTGAIKAGEAAVTKTGDGSEDIEKAVKATCPEVHDATPLKRYVRTKKKCAQGAAKMSGSKLQNAKEIELIENPAANLEVDMQHHEVKTELAQGEPNTQDSLDVKRDQYLAKNASGRNNGMSNEARANREEMCGDRQKPKKVIIKFSLKPAAYKGKDDETGVAACLKFSDQTNKAEEKEMNSDINVEERRAGNTAVSYGGNKSLPKTASETPCQTPADLQNKMNVANTESTGHVKKTSSQGLQELARNETMAGDIQMDLPSREATKAMDGLQELPRNETMAGDIQMDLPSWEATKAMDGGVKGKAENHKKKI